MLTYKNENLSHTLNSKVFKTIPSSWNTLYRNTGTNNVQIKEEQMISEDFLTGRMK